LIDLLSWSIKPLLKLLVAGIALSGLLIFIFKAEDLHKAFLRKHVGSRVYKVMVNTGAGGTAFAIKGPSGKTYILTNDHICVSSTDGFLYIVDSMFTIPIKIIERSQRTDLCLLDAPNNLVGLDISTTAPSPGDSVRAVGHPKLDDLTVSNKGELISIMAVSFSDSASNKSPSVTVANCDTSNPKYKIQYYKGKSYCTIDVPAAYSTSVLVKKGNSGSPLVDFNGDVVGIISGMDEYNWGMAVTRDEIIHFLNGR